MTSVVELWLRLALLGLAAACAECVLRRTNGAVRHSLWLIILAAAIAMPLARMTFEEQTWTVEWWRVPAAAAFEPAAVPPAASGVESTRQAPPKQTSPIWPYAILCYSAVAAGLLSRQLSAANRLKSLRLEAERVEPGETLDIAARMNLAASVEILASPSVEVPFTAGWRVPRIYLPADWTEWPAAKRASVLAHEMAHVQRHDWLIGRTAAVARSLFWAHPLFWLAERRLAALAEEAVDETALALVGDPRAYAGAILDFALARTEQFEPMETTAMARSSKVGSRVERILSNKNFNIARIGGFTFACMAAAALPVLYAAALIMPAPQQEAAPSTAVKERVMPSEQPTSNQIREYEAKVAAEPEDGAARIQLIMLYKRAGRDAEAEKQALWLVENRPAKPEALKASIIVGGGLETPIGQRLNALWRRNAEKYPSDPAILQAAARHARLSGEYLRAESLLNQALVVQPDLQTAQKERAQLFAGALYASTGGLNGAQPEAGFVKRTQKMVESGTEMPLVGMVGELMTPPNVVTSSPEAAEAASKANATRGQIAERLLRRADELDPDNPRWKAALERLQQARMGGGLVTVSELPAAEPGHKRITVGGNVQASMLLKHADPEYPPLARQARIQGTVRFSVIIDKTGKVAYIRLISGHPLLVQSAKDVLQKYEYKPTTINGEPMEVVSQVDVNFTLGPSAEVR